MDKQKRNAQKLIDEFKGERNEWDRLWGLLWATRAVPELGEVYDTVMIAARIDTLKNKMLDDMKIRDDNTRR